MLSLFDTPTRRRLGAATLALLTSACAGDAEPEGEDTSPAAATAPAATPPLTPFQDPARVQSISPTSGAPGTQVTIRAGGLSAGTEFEIGFGAPNTNFEILGRATSDASGELSATFAVPAWAEPGGGYMFVVAPVDQPPRAASDTFRVTAPGPR